MKSHDKKLKLLEQAALQKLSSANVEDITIMNPVEREELKRKILRELCITDRPLILELFSETAGEITQAATDAEYQTMNQRLKYFRDRWIQDADMETLREHILDILEKRFSMFDDVSNVERLEMLLYKQTEKQGAE